MTDTQPILELRHLKKYFARQSGLLDTLLRREAEYVHAVDDVSLSLHEQEIKGVIGESGCGKSTLLMTIGRLLAKTSGDILYNGAPLSEFSKQDRLEFHRNVQIVFQDPFNSLNPKMSVRETLREPLQIHDFDDQEERIYNVLERVELNPPERFIDQMPHSLSGGEKQRVAIARALILEPNVILADEPVSMLDVSTQASILKLLKDLSADFNISILYISHDISTVSYLCDEINVMYLGRIIETAPTQEVINNPKHPYTEALMNAVPVPNPHRNRERTQLEGSTPDATDIGEGCRFRARCPERMDICEQTPRKITLDGNHDVACHLHYDHEQEEPVTDMAMSPRGGSQ